MNAIMEPRLFADDAPDYKRVSFPDPRPFQQSAHESLRQGFKAGHKNQMIMAPTGAGKSYLGHRIAHEALLRGKRAVFVCDREALIDQTSESADEYGLSAHAIIKADHWRRDPDMPYQIASIQTITKRGYWPPADVIIIDEAHTQYKGWTEYIMKTEAACIGLSASPFSPGLGELFTNLINAATMDELTRQGILVPMRPLSCVRPDMKGAATSGGEWTDRAAEERGMGIVGDVVSEWLRHGDGRKTIVFGSTIRHCTELARQFIEAGVSAAVYTTDTPPTERDRLRAEFKKPNSAIRVLISVEALAKGFDVKDVGCVVDCRPLRKSLSTAIQMWGRGLRASQETGKKDCILLDHSGNILRFLADYESIYYRGLSALDAGEKLDKTVREKEEFDPKGCPSCRHKPFSKLCMACGYEYEPPALDAPAAAGEMLPVMLGKKKLADDQRHLWEQLCTYARATSAPEKQAGRAWHLFKDIAGAEPPRVWRFEDTPNVEITRNVQNKVRSLFLAFVKGKGRRAHA